MTRPITRRTCMKMTAAATGLVILPSGLARAYAANETVSVGIIGSGGRGGANLKGVAEAGARIAALCDVDRGRLDGSARRFPQAAKHTDFRRLLDQEKSLDAVVVSTPDHTHAPASVRAMRQGLHCYCEKPLTYNVHEARVMTQLAKEKKLSTHMGTPSRGKEGTVRAAEILRSGALGDITEAHFWTNRPIWPQGYDRPAGEDPVGEGLDWDLWLGPAPKRPYKHQWPEGHPVYQSKWRHRVVYHLEWLDGIKNNDPDQPSCPFSYAGPLTEAYLLGNIAMKLNQKIEWDAKAMRITNCEAANQYIQREYRKGWEI